MPKISWLAEALQMDEETVFDMIRRQVESFFRSQRRRIHVQFGEVWLSEDGLFVDRALGKIRPCSGVKRRYVVHVERRRYLFI